MFYYVIYFYKLTLKININFFYILKINAFYLITILVIIFFNIHNLRNKYFKEYKRNKYLKCSMYNKYTSLTTLKYYSKPEFLIIFLNILF